MTGTLLAMAASPDTDLRPAQVAAKLIVGPPGLRELAALLFADEALMAQLAAQTDGRGFADAAIRCATEHDLVLTESDLRDTLQADPLGLARWAPPALGGRTLPPRHWLPAAVTATPSGLAVDWLYFGAEALPEAFYEDSLRRALSLPINRALRYRTPLDDLIGQTAARDNLKPDGFIFHMSRCGSTLVAQMLAALDDSLVISEAAPIDSALQLGRAVDAAAAAEVLRAMVLAFGRKRAGRERRYFVKLDCWHTLALPVFRRAFPDVPWLFLYRDPVEVLVSQMRQRGMQTVPQYLPPGFYGIVAAERMTEEDYCARVLAAVCRAALDHRGLGGGLFLDYRHLPQAVFDVVLPHFGLSCSDAEAERMGQAAQRNAKSPGFAFVADSQSKQDGASAAVRRASGRHLDEIYARLERSAERRDQLNTA